MSILVGTNVTGFMAYYRQHFPTASVLPKMHILEAHVPGWLKKWNIGLGFMGEQGAESIHASFNNIESSYVNMPNKVDRLFRIVQDDHLRTNPDLQSLVPAIKTRKKNNYS